MLVFWLRGPREPHEKSAGDHDGKVVTPLSAKQMGGLVVSVRVATEKGLKPADGTHQLRTQPPFLVGW